MNFFFLKANAVLFIEESQINKWVSSGLSVFMRSLSYNKFGFFALFFAVFMQDRSVNRNRMCLGMYRKNTKESPVCARGFLHYFMECIPLIGSHMKHTVSYSSFASSPICSITISGFTSLFSISASFVSPLITRILVRAL